MCFYLFYSLVIFYNIVVIAIGLIHVSRHLVRPVANVGGPGFDWDVSE